MRLLKEEHPRAAHHCFAYRLGMDGNHFRVGDGGEPPGTAGKPILGQLDSRKLVNAMVVVVRYFGGTLLGVPGLINAYKTAASLSLQLTPIVQKPVMVAYDIEFDYTLLNEVMVLLKRAGCNIQQQELHLFCRMRADIPKSETGVVARLEELQGVAVRKVGG